MKIQSNYCIIFC